jgi:Protein of unknown function (DUF992)
MRCIARGLAAVIFAASLCPVQAQSIANLGTLSCILDPAEAQPFGVERKLSCAFHPITGVTTGFIGTVKRLGADVPHEGQIVLVWSVRAPNQNTPPSNLEGRYIGDLDAERDSGAHGLVGGSKSQIELIPLTASPDLGSNAALSVLELELAAMKA